MFLRRLSVLALIVASGCAAPGQFTSPYAEDGLKNSIRSHEVGSKNGGGLLGIVESTVSNELEVDFPTIRRNEGPGPESRLAADRNPALRGSLDQVAEPSVDSAASMQMDGYHESTDSVLAAAPNAVSNPVHVADSIAPVHLTACQSPSASTNETVAAELPIAAEPFQLPGSQLIENPVPLNLPSVLAAIDGTHPIVGKARWRVQQAYARYDQAHVLWLPSIQAGFSFHRHDGNYQASDGTIVDVNRNSFQYGLGAGATGAGTTAARPGVLAQFHLADALFSPKVAKKEAWAEGHAANATRNQQLLTAALAYIDLVDAHQELRIVEQSRNRFSEVADITVDFAEAGEGLQSDSDRLRTELALIESRLIGVQERVSVAAARLAQAISLDDNGTIVPTDVNVVPLDLTSPGAESACFVATALQTRPELKQSQALVAAACDAYQREKFAPFVPSVLLGFSTGGFGGGLGNDLENIDDRYDFDAMLTWQVRNLGMGEKAARREQTARVQQARFEKLRVMDQVAREVSESHSQVKFRSQQIDMAFNAIKYAEDSYRRNLERIRDGEGLPLEVLQSARALETAQQTYLNSVKNYNQAQFRLQWALGFPAH